MIIRQQYWAAKRSLTQCVTVCHAQPINREQAGAAIIFLRNTYVFTTNRNDCPRLLDLGQQLLQSRYRRSLDLIIF